MTEAAASSQKHTPGPWKVAMAGEAKPLPCGVYSQSTATGMVCRIPQEHESAVGNAVLIAEAPAMLAALERACNAYEALLESNGAQAVIGSENAADTAGDWVRRRMADAMADARTVAVAAGRGKLLMAPSDSRDKAAGRRRIEFAAAIERLGWSQAETARRLGLSLSSVEKRLSGAVAVRAGELAAMKSFEAAMRR